MPPYVHASWWFKKHQASFIGEKVFEPSGSAGEWSAIRSAAEPRLYQDARQKRHHRIGYRLPGLRIGEVRGDRHSVVSGSDHAGERATEVYQFFWTTHGWIKPFAPILRMLMRIFLDQDRLVVVRQREGLMSAPKLMLVNDADTQARWWKRIRTSGSTPAARTVPSPIPEAHDAPLAGWVARDDRRHCHRPRFRRALERGLLARVASAAGRAALEAERVAALGKKGVVSDLLKGLGAMTPEERQVMGRP